MTKEELREHCEKQVKMCEEWAKCNDREPSGKIYEEHKLILDLIKALEQQPSDCKIFGTKENCFGGATENECEHCDYKIQKLEQQPCEDLINQVNEQGNKKITNWLDNFFGMEFPKTFDEFANDYGFTDDKEIYTNGSHLIPVFRVKQWLDHIEKQPSEDCVSRKSMLDAITEIDDNINMDIYTNEVREIVNELPPVTPTHCFAEVRFSKEDLREICNERIEIECMHGTCKDCKHNYKTSGNTFECSNGHRFALREPSTFYCADFEK